MSRDNLYLSSLLTRLLRHIYEKFISRQTAQNAARRAIWQLILLFQRKLDTLFRFPRNKAVPRDDSRASIPPNYWVIISRRANRFGFFEPSHRLSQKIISLKPAIRCVLTQFHLRAAFRHDSGIIRVVVC